MARILHVTECHYGGVSRAIRKLMELSSEHEHYLLVNGEDEEFSPVVHKVRKLESKGILRRTREVRRAVEDFRPDYVHLHSSWAGVYGRLTGLKARIIYQPHCYKFDDATLAAPKKFLFRIAEKLLSYRSDATVVLSPHEEKLTRELNAAVKCFYVPNAPSCELRPDMPNDFEDEIATRRVLMVGRICAQKDPTFYGEVARIATASPLLSAWEFRWVGDGEAQLRSDLEAAGVEVSGWREGSDLLAELDAGDFYVHSAAYEGFPISILDAAARRMPIVARRIDALDGSSAFQVESPRDVVEALERATRQPEFLATLLARSKSLLDSMNEVNQERAWRDLYSASTVVAA